jgi:fatty-acyl-CoA synthase
MSVELITRARSQTLGDVLRRTAARRPDKVAVIDHDVKMTYAELDAAVNRAANRLAARGMEHGDRVALLSHNGWEYVVLSFATARLGVILVPLNFMLTAGEVAYILKHSGATGFVVEDRLHAVAEAAINEAQAEMRVRGWISRDGVPPPDGWDRVSAWVGSGEAHEPRIVVADDDPVRLMYTSGTESRPKGAIHSSRSLLAQYVSCIVDGEMSASDVDVHSMPMYHCAQLDCFLGPDVYLGATSVILPTPDPRAILAAIERHGATKLFAPPTVWIALLESPAFDTSDLSTLTKGYYGASAMPVEVLRDIQRRLPGVRLWNFYGQTELAPLATALRPEDQIAHPGSAGRPVLNVETRVVNEDGSDTRPGEIGEIVHRSPQLTLGYWHDSDRTADAFAGGWFHSGDLGVIDEAGLLSVVDRKKDMIKTGGENVASREVEEAIYEHPSVAEAAVFGLPDPRWIEAVVAAVVPRTGVELSAEEIVRHCRTRLAGYKTPKRVLVVESLPKNPSGKILKRELRQRFGERTEENVG